ncbi:hypothetical protein [Halobacillus sp. BBL2006]|uniref:hypothetical protein n=1 Tax=Halobacillus sp. BBL2006 TaxID=1543706 RepID=UPI000543B0DF|nr:hypothetical protein [Halobacillus sp. BBL2006]KHE73197.1 hypothetical protein LD39_00550 [Halobacillus sp. BBL2006]
MHNLICITCGTQYSSSLQECVICKEERQYVNPNGQEWTTLEDMVESGTYSNQFIYDQEGLVSVTTEPKFGIGQTAYIVEHNGFRLLWDCIAYLDKNTINQIAAEGGIDAIALSHPHYYTTQVEWAGTFNCPIYIHEDDKEWVQRQSERIVFWSGEAKTLSDGLTLYRLGGHFSGGAVLHWQNQEGVLLTGDIIQVVADTDWVSFMYSYPNLIPLPPEKVKQIAEKVMPLKFDELYNAFHKKVSRNANRAVQRSAQRYIAAIQGEWFNT